MLYVKRIRIWAVLLSLVILLTPTGATARSQQDLPLLEEIDPAVYDAQVYAAEFGITTEEAVRRLNLQDAVGDLDVALMSGRDAAIYAGLWIQHEPSFRVVVLFTDSHTVDFSYYTKNSELLAIIEQQTANVSYADLESTQNEVISYAGSLGIPFESGINVQENSVELYVLAEDYDAVTVVPPNVTVIIVPSMSQPTVDSYGDLAP